MYYTVYITVFVDLGIVLFDFCSMLAVTEFLVQMSLRTSAVFVVETEEIVTSSEEHSTKKLTSAENVSTFNRNLSH